jgi:hypothetical protein
LSSTWLKATSTSLEITESTKPHLASVQSEDEFSSGKRAVGNNLERKKERDNCCKDSFLKF